MFIAFFIFRHLFHHERVTFKVFDSFLVFFFRFIVWRKANHVVIRLGVQPKPDVQPDEDVVVGFTLQYTYFNTVADKSVGSAAATSTPSLSGTSKEQKWHALNTRIYINLGKLQPVGVE